MSVASVTITLDDGSGCYVTVIRVDSFTTVEVSEAVGKAAASFIETFVRESVERGYEWDPVAWRARYNSLQRSIPPTERA